METPEFVSGIPTDKHASAQRRMIIKAEYIKLMEKLQNKYGKKAVFNEFLQTDVYIIMRESEKKASNSAAFNWQSTYAVKHLETIIKEAVPMEGKPIYTLPKPTGKQKEFKYVNMATLYYTFHSTEYEHLNFTIKLAQRIFSVGGAWLIRNKGLPLRHETRRSATSHPTRCADGQLRRCQV